MALQRSRAWPLPARHSLRLGRCERPRAPLPRRLRHHELASPRALLARSTRRRPPRGRGVCCGADTTCGVRRSCHLDGTTTRPAGVAVAGGACPRRAGLEYFGMRSQEAAHADAVPSPPAGTATFYRYRDASGRVVVVDSLTRVPASQRNLAEQVALAPGAGLTVLPPDGDAGLTGSIASTLGQQLHVPSFLAGASSALVCALLVTALQRKLGRTLKGALALGVLALGVVGYFGWVRRTTGQSAELLASPRALIDDARAAVGGMNRSLAEQERVLKELEHER